VAPGTLPAWDSDSDWDEDELSWGSDYSEPLGAGLLGTPGKRSDGGASGRWEPLQMQASRSQGHQYGSSASSNSPKWQPMARIPGGTPPGSVAGSVVRTPPGSVVGSVAGSGDGAGSGRGRPGMGSVGGFAVEYVECSTSRAESEVGSAVESAESRRLASDRHARGSFDSEAALVRPLPHAQRVTVQGPI
jgi:hypothetical protein